MSECARGHCRSQPACPVGTCRSPDLAREGEFVSGPCGICCGKGRWADDRWCEACGKTGIVHMMVEPARSPDLDKAVEAARVALLEYAGYTKAACLPSDYEPEARAALEAALPHLPPGDSAPASPEQPAGCDICAPPRARKPRENREVKLPSVDALTGHGDLRADIAKRAVLEGEATWGELEQAAPASLTERAERIVAEAVAADVYSPEAVARLVVAALTDANLLAPAPTKEDK